MHGSKTGMDKITKWVNGTWQVQLVQSSLLQTTSEAVVNSFVDALTSIMLLEEGYMTPVG